jgi:adenosylhomocysteine nucleosidase
MIFTRGVKIPRDGVDKPARQFWIPVDAKLFEIARTATSGVELKRCIEAACLVHAPKVVVGGNGVSGSAFVDNAAFRMWTFETFKAQVLDMESAAVAHVAVTNSVPFLAFRSLSDSPAAAPARTRCRRSRSWRRRIPSRCCGRFSRRCRNR